MATMEETVTAVGSSTGITMIDETCEFSAPRFFDR
jgi:hypothetical protein